jgi:HEAT repeat protein
MPIKRSDVKNDQIKNEKRKFSREFEGLIHQLSSNIPYERRWAARDLADYSDASRYLLDHMDNEKDISVREVIISSLLKIRDEIAINGLIDYLKSDDAHLRNSAIEALKQIPDEVSPHIDKLIHDSDPDVRIFTINILESLRHPNVIKWLVEVIDKDQNINVCATALDLLAEVGTEETIPAIKKLKDRFKDEPYIQFTADIALRRIEGGE